MLRDVLTLLNEAGVWEHLPRPATQSLVINIVELACRRYDCNAGEILDSHDALGICYCCRKAAEPLRRGLCLSCWSADDEEDWAKEKSWWSERELLGERTRASNLSVADFGAMIEAHITHSANGACEFPADVFVDLLFERIAVNADVPVTLAIDGQGISWKRRREVWMSHLLSDASPRLPAAPISVALTPAAVFESAICQK
jgi:hypothetical protein